MFTLALSFTRHTTIRMEELAGAATAVAGALLFLSSGVPMGRRGGQALGGLRLTAESVRWVLALHWGK